MSTLQNNLCTALICLSVATSLALTVCAAPPSRSNNALLSSLSLSDNTLSPAFAADITEYTTSISNAGESITVTAIPRHIGATAAISGTTADGSTALTLNDGNILSDLAPDINIIMILVMAEDEITKMTYTVTTNRPQPIYIWRTQAVFTGNIIDTGDRSTADALCSRDSNARDADGKTYTHRAILALPASHPRDLAVPNANLRFMSSGVSRLVVHSYRDFFDSTQNTLANISVDTMPEQYWTGLDASLEIGEHCNGWTSNSNTVSGDTGLDVAINRARLHSNTTNCDRTLPFLCLSHEN